MLTSTPTLTTAKGSFDARVTPQAPGDEGAGPIGRLLIEKDYRGDLAGTGRGQMLGAQTVQGSGGYVAMEVVTGTLHGRRGSFVLTHAGSMKGGAVTITGDVVPDSGTDELAGLTGRYTITIDGRRHDYTLEYAFRTD